MTEPIRGAGQPSWPLSPYQVSYGAGASGQNAGSGGIARGTGADWFGPLDPLRPIAPPEVAGRRFDFPPGYNLVTRPRAYESVGFAELRAFADAYDLLRLVIETRKDQMERQRWRIRPRDPKLKRKSGSTNASKSAMLDADMSARISALEAFFHKPDGVTRWKTWLRALLEDMFVIDAATLYCQRTRTGQLCALPQLDGSTVKRLIDDWGRTPQPYAGADGVVVYPPAYQQVFKGLPAVDYSARDIIYRPRNVRAHRVYGYSPVQQILMTVNIALRRQLWQLDYYSEGSIPDALIGVPQGWTPDQIKQFQDYWDTEFSGDLARRRKAKFVPGDTAVKIQQTKEPEQKNDFDEWLARIICYAFSVPPQWAVKAMNRATADNQSAQAEDEGLEPTKEWVKDLIDQIITEEFASPDLELVWLAEEDNDLGKNEAALENRVKLGALTLNELRDALGLDPYTNAAADRPMVLTATGYVPIEAGVGGQSAAAETDGHAGKSHVRSLAVPVLKAAADDPEHPGWPAGTPDGKGGQFRPKDGDGGEQAANSFDTADAIAMPRSSYAGPDSGTDADGILASTETSLPDAQDDEYAVGFKRFDLTPNDFINLTSLKLSIIFEAVIELNPPASGMTPQQYGTFIHLEFANVVRGAGLPGILSADVETTFPEGQSYGSPDSIRTDVVLRDDDGNILAIFDVKTGATGLTEARAAQLRAKTGAEPNTPVVEIRMEGILLKGGRTLSVVSTQGSSHDTEDFGGA